MSSLANIFRITGYSPFKALLLKEYWEYKRTILWLPLIVAALTLLIAFVTVMGSRFNYGSIHTNINGFAVNHVTDVLKLLSAMEEGERARFITSLLISLPFFIWAVTWINMILTSLSTLYNERKDNNILFWKSMPVSDAMTVGAKLVSIILVAPLIAVSIGFVLQFITLVLISSLTLGTEYSGWELFWVPSNLPGLLLIELTHMVMYGLWALPFFSFFMLASVVAKKTPLLYAAIPLIIISILEGILNNTSHFHKFLEIHLGGVLVFGQQLWADNMRNFNFFDAFAIIETAMLPSFWYGLAISAICLYATIQLRKRNNH